MSASLTHIPARRRVYYAILAVLATGLALLALLIPYLQRTLTAPPQVGQVAQQDYRALQSQSFTSQTLTEQRREEAQGAIQPIYSPPDASIARQKLERLRAAQAFITSVRSDAYATPQQKLDDLAALEDMHLSSTTAISLLALSDARWQIIQQEALVALEKVMGTPIHPDELENARELVPSLVSLTLPESQANLAAELASAFVSPNVQFSAEMTESARQEVIQAIQPVIRRFMTGQTVVQKGQVISAADLEALEQLGLIEDRQSWEDLASAAVLTLLITALVVIYLVRERKLARDWRNLTIMAVLFLVFLFGARLIIPAHTIMPYAYPLSAFALTISILFGAEVAIVTTLPLAILSTYGLPNALELTLYYTLSSLFGILALGRARRMSSFFLAGLAVAFSGTLIVWIYHLPLPTTDNIGLVTLTGAAFFSGLSAASLTVLLQYILANFLGMITPMQLIDLSRPDHPLLQRILHEAPGTYQHSLQLANLVEQASERIGADPMLARVGALYHDAGKALNPGFFIENQLPGDPNPHEELDPTTSAAIIIRHVSDGMELGRKHHLPPSILAFVSEHHGTMLTRYQYVRAVQAAGGDESQIDKDLFRYPGPRPQSRESAILMLADGSEARVRAERPKGEEELRRVLKEVISNRVSTGQLDSTHLTLRDLDIIQESFVATLRGMYHPRIEYPPMEKTASSEIATRPVTPAIDSQPTTPSAENRSSMQASQ